MRAASAFPPAPFRDPPVAEPAARPGRGEYWRHLFAHWPAGIPRTGFLTTELNESVRFVDFLVSGGLLLLQRDKPDTQGCRKALVSYDAISLVKLEDPGELARYRAMSFQPPAG